MRAEKNEIEDRKTIEKTNKKIWFFGKTNLIDKLQLDGLIKKDKFLISEMKVETFKQMWQK